MTDRPVADREPLSAEEEADLREWVANVEPKGTPTEIARLLATLDATRAHPDEAGLRAAVRAEIEALDTHVMSPKGRTRGKQTIVVLADVLAAVGRAQPAVPVAGAEDEVERLRRQNHEFADRRNREMAALQSEVDRWHNAAARAKEMVRGSPVDWTTGARSQEPDGWWNYTSQNNREILTVAVAALRAVQPEDDGLDRHEGPTSRDCPECERLHEGVERRDGA